MDLVKGKKVYSPCVAICILDKSEDYCVGCGRSILEIQDWDFMDDEEKLGIVKQLSGRVKKMKS